MSNQPDPVVEAIQDLTRVMIALQGNFASKSDAVRKLHQLSIPTARIAALLAVPASDVRSLLSKERKKNAGGDKEGKDG